MASSQTYDQEDETEVLQFNLTNPEQLTEQLKSADLNDQETDVLLKEAMRVNAQLKEALRMQQLEDEQGPKMRKTKSPSGYSGPLAPRNPKQSTLPPINLKNDRSALNSGKQGNKGSKAKSISNGQKGSLTPKRKGSANKSKPAWDDRFAFG